MWHLLKLATIFLRCIPAFFRSRNEQVIVELALRQQLATFAENGPRPRITSADRGFWILLSQVWSGWKDILVVPTVRFRLLYAWFVIDHGRREIIHFGVTAHPTLSWVIQHLREAFPNDTSPRFLIFGNDSIFSERVTESIKSIGIEPQRERLFEAHGRMGLPRVGGLHHRYEWRDAA